MLLAAHGPAAAQIVANLIDDSFERPVHVTVAPGKRSHLYVVEHAGRIRLLINEATRAKPFLDIRDIVLSPPDTGAGNEQGLLSVAFSPNYRQDGLFYVAFNNLDSDIELNEFQRSSNARRADPQSRRVLLTIPHSSHTNHNGGQLQFGRDGYLYLSTGDGGGSGDPGDNALDIEVLLGKILRIDPAASDTLAYSIPQNNPFVGQPGRDEIFAYGLRNPWRFAFDRRRMLIADVGQNMREEVDILPTKKALGANFGWREFEGDLPFKASVHTPPGPAKAPQFVYDHDTGCSITGGFIVRDPDLPDLAGRYVYGDYCSGDVRSFIPTNPATDDAPTGINIFHLTSFGMGFRGQLYATAIGGDLVRLDPTTDGPSRVKGGAGVVSGR
jgi:glucose/arabinose dehydrogenase